MGEPEPGQEKKGRNKFSQKKLTDKEKGYKMKKIFGKKMILAALIAGLFAGAPLMALAQGHGPAGMHQKGPAMNKAPMKKNAPPMKHYNPPMKKYAAPVKHFNPPPRPMPHRGPAPIYMVAPPMVHPHPVVMVPAPPPPPPPPPPFGYDWRMVNGNRVLVNLGGIMIRLAW